MWAGTVAGELLPAAVAAQLGGMGLNLTDVNVYTCTHFLPPNRSLCDSEYKVRY